jgi:vancomycin resistance protein YoaR
MFEKKTTNKLVFNLILAVLILISVVGGCLIAFSHRYFSKIYPGIYCDDIYLGGLGEVEAEVILKNSVEKIEKNGFVFFAKTDKGEKEIIVQSQLIALGDPDLSRRTVYFNTKETIKRALQLGRNGNIFRRLIDIGSILAKHRNIELVFEINNQEITETIKSGLVDLENPGKNAGFLVSSKGISLSKEEDGFILDYESALEQFQKNLKIFKNERIEVPVIIQNPQITIKDSNEAFSSAQEISKSAPFVLTYQDKKWSIDSLTVGGWLELEKGQRDNVVLGINPEEVKKFLQIISEKINIDPSQPKLEIKDDRVVEFQISRPGLILNQEQSYQSIIKEILDKNKEISLVVDVIDPLPIANDTEALGIRELVGEGFSDFSGSPKNRKINIKVGSEKLHGILIKPDEEFSLIKAIGPVNGKAGFLPELVIKGDRTVPEFGGGLCQIGTTTFRLAINAGLPITERSPHSYRVVYYEPAGTDATIYDPNPDLKFINDTGHHLLLQTKIEENKLIFKFYGTKDGRKVKTGDPKIFNVVNPPSPKFIETTELLPGEKKRIESAHSGADAEFKNTITFSNGIVREEIWRSHYRPWPEVWLVGKELEKIEIPEEIGAGTATPVE